jgi:hypothetical protein
LNRIAGRVVCVGCSAGFEVNISKSDPSAVALRQTELRLAGGAPELRQQLQTDMPGVVDDEASPYHVSEASLVFKEHLERLSELLLILLIGGTLLLDSWSWRAVGFSLFLFTIAGPLSVVAGLLGTRTPWRIRGLVGWFGVRGIGSLYYLMYAIQHGLREELALKLIHLTLVVVTLSILVHGIITPLLTIFNINADTISAAEQADKKAGINAPGIVETKDIAEQGFIFGLPIAMNYVVMNEFAIDKNSGQYKAPFNSIRNLNSGYCFSRYTHTHHELSFHIPFWMNG